MKPKRRKFEVSVEMPEGVGVREMQDYIRDAVGTWAKSTDPESPIFDLNYDSVKVKVVKEEKV
jgi:hypothetical protein